MAPTDDLTPSTTELKVGETANFLVEEPEGKVTVAVKPVTIVAGAPEDVAQVKVDNPEVAGWIPWYITVEYTHLGGPTMAYPYLNLNLEALDATNTTLGKLTVIGTFDKCESKGPDAFSKGDTYSECSIYLAPPGTEVTKAYWSADFGDTYVTWSA